MRVIKRNGEYENVSFDKVLNRIKILCNGLDVNEYDVAQKVCSRIYDGVRTSELDELAAHICSSMIIDHPDYDKLASRITISNHQKNTSPSFSETINMLYNNVDESGVHNPLVSDNVYNIVLKNKEKLNSYIDYSRDFDFDYFGFKTLERSYLMKINGKIVERPQHMFMRVSLGIHGDDIKDALQTYDYMSKKYFIHATPTLFNSGTPRPQLSSCFLLSNEDSIDGIFNTLKECALISKYAGGIGMHIHDIRGKGSRIRGTNGESTGILPMLRVYNNGARFVNQCVTPDKLVFTKAGIKRMDEVTTDDYLVTHDGTYKKVNSVSVNEKVNDEIVVIDVKHASQPLKCTKVHEIFVIDTGNSMFCFRDISKKLEAGSIKPEYIPAEKVTTDHLMVYPIPKYENDILDLTLDDMRLYGIMIGDGSIINKNQWSVNVNAFTSRFVKAYLYSKDIQYSECADNDKKCIVWLQSSNIPFTYNDLYDSNKVKHIHPQYMHLPKNKVAMILKGMLETDGYVADTGVYYGSPSLKVIQSMKYMLLRIGILATLDIKDTETPTRKVSYDLRIPKVETLKELDIFINFEPVDCGLYYQHEDWLLSKVVNTSRTLYTGKVYDFNMMDNHNYLTDSGLIHNSGRRNGSIAVYLEPWHCDIEGFLELRKPHGHEEERTRDLFLALWVCDLFMERVKADGVWSLMCPNTCPGLSDVYGDEFKALYEKYESEGKFVKQIPAQKIWFKILESQIESGQPYILYKDAANKKSNQKNLGTIKSSNLCTEIIELSNHEETAVCNLASIALPTYVKSDDGGKPYYDFEELHEIAKVVTKNLNKVIDINFYPVEKTKRSNLRHRPIGIGVQGLADTFVKMGYTFESEEARQLNKDIFETIYHGSVESSHEIAKKRHMIIKGLEDISSIKSDMYLNINEHENTTGNYPGAYSTFEGSPASQGILQFDMWNVEPSNRYDWKSLKESIKTYGLRNSLLLAPMPTASTSQILGFNECFEPFTSNIYKRKTLAGEFILVNKYLLQDLMKLGLWNKEIKDKMIIDDGSIQNIPEIPDDIKRLYKTVWEISQKVIIDMAADRGAYICQSQSMNLFMEEPTFKKLTSMHFYAWSKGLKTGMYYLRSKPKASAQKFTIDPSLSRLANSKEQTAPKSPPGKKSNVVCTDEVCVICSS